MEVYNLLRALETRGVRWSTVQSWFESGIHVQYVRKSDFKGLARLFNDKFRKLCMAHRMMRGQASQVQSMVPLLQHFVDTVLPPREQVILQPFWESFSCLCEVVCLLDMVKQPGSGNMAALLREKIEKHVRAYTQAYGEALVHPKHHIALHVPQQVSEDNMLLD